MAKRKIQLNEQQVNELKRYESQSKRPDEVKRMQAVRLYGTGYATKDIMEIVNCAEISIRQWAMSYMQSGIEGLVSHYDQSAQNARKLSAVQEADLCKKLHQYRPDEVLGSDQCYGTGQFWTVEDVETVAKQWYGVTYRTTRSYRQLLHRCGFSYQKAERIYKSRPAEAEVADFEAELEKK